MTERNNLIRIIIISMVIVLLVVLIIVFTGRENEVFFDKYSDYDLTGSSSGRTNIYLRYIERHSNAPDGISDIPVDIFRWNTGKGISVHQNYLNERQVLQLEEESYIEYTVYVERAGMYNVYIEYYPLPSRGIPIERSFKINGETPFLGADRLSFQRIWGNGEPVRVDNQGNQIRPKQVELPRWENAWFRDPLGYITEPYSFYFPKGENIISLEGINEPMAIRALSLKKPNRLLNYRDYIASLDLDRYKNNRQDFSLKVQGESAVRRSDPSINAIFDRSSGATEPASIAKVLLNMIGGQNWRIAGQWIEWEFEVPENGLYRFSVKGRQNYNRGYVSNRSIMIDGQIPCQELSAIPFPFNNKWKLVTFQDAEGDLLFPLDKGTHTFRMQVNLGELGEILNVMEESVYRLNNVYRKILVLTGSEPDPFRDYRIDFVYPEVITAMEFESRILYKIVDDLTNYSGERSGEAAVALTLARQLELFVRRPDKISKTLGNFKGNISALGDSMLSLSQSQLDIDFLVVSAAEVTLPKIRDNFFIAASHEIRSFLSSFIVNYDNIGDVYVNDKNVVNVWIMSGRDQSIILKSMIDDTFTPQTGIKVNVKLVAGDAVMPAIVAGIGPDMALNIGQADVVNYAVRKAVVDISKFPGYNELVSELNPSVIVPFEFQGGVYGLPETQYYHVMYYRKDIFEELEIEIPDTWDELINILPLIQKRNMNVGIPSVANASAPDFSNFLAHLFQRGGTLYNNDGSRTLLDTETAIEAFDVYTKFYTHYKVPVVFDFVNRLRTGEMPLAFADYSLFNTLEVFAPEIRGLWNFARMPGLKKSDGSIDRSVPTGTVASMIFSNSKNPEMAWEFLKWWISADTQVRFGRELESIMGAAARYPTANYKAFRQLPWSAEQMAVLDEQRRWTVGTPEVPGGYFVNRHIINAVRKILNEGQDTRETLLDYTITINDELVKKRKEFGLE